jgi:hypothetical protein
MGISGQASRFGIAVYATKIDVDKAIPKRYNDEHMGLVSAFACRFSTF